MIEKNKTTVGQHSEKKVNFTYKLDFDLNVCIHKNEIMKPVIIDYYDFEIGTR